MNLPLVVLLLCTPGASWAQVQESPPATEPKTHRFQVGPAFEYSSTTFELPQQSAVAAALQQGSQLDTGLTSASTSGFRSGDYRSSLGLLDVGYRFAGIGALWLEAHVGLGWEHLRLDTTDFDPSLAWRSSFEITYNFASVDLGASFTYRGGRAEGDLVDVKSPGTADYRYDFFQPGVEIGWHATPGVRAFAGIRYTFDEAEYSSTTTAASKSEGAPSTTTTTTTDLDLRRNWGVRMGLEFELLPIVATLELRFIDVDLGVAASLSWVF